MPVPDALARDLSIAGPLGSLALSQLRPSATTLTLRSVRWHEGLERLGLTLPYFLVHDVGMLFAAPKEQFELVTRVEPNQLFGDRPQIAAIIASYKRILEEIGDSEASRKAGQLKLNDDLVIIVLARLLGAVAARVTVRPAYRAKIPVDAALFERIEPQLGPLFRVCDRGFELATLDGLGVARLFVVTLADALDTDTLRLFGMLGAEGSGALSHVDLLSALESPEANDVVNFSLEILPSVLETKTRPAARHHRRFRLFGPRHPRLDRQHGALGASLGRHRAHPPAPRQRSALLLARAIARRAATHPHPAHRRVGLDARRPADVRAGHGSRHRQEAGARGGRGMLPLLRLPPLRNRARQEWSLAHRLSALVQGGARA